MGLAQSVFQVGGYVGSAIGPLLAAFIVLPRGQDQRRWFSAGAMVAYGSCSSRWAYWYKAHGIARLKAEEAVERGAHRRAADASAIHRRHSLALIFSKYFYMASLTSYYTLYLIDRFNVTVQQSQLLMFVFLGAVAAGHAHRRAAR